MENLSMIAAIGKNNELGKDNDLIWRLSGDMKFFRAMTNDKVIIMGRKTLESLPNGRPLPNRVNIVLTKDENYEVENAYVLNSIEEALDLIALVDKECFVIGGASIYEEFMPYAENIYLTKIAATDPDADTYFPTFHPAEFYATEICRQAENDIKYSLFKYTRKKEKEWKDCHSLNEKAEKLILSIIRKNRKRYEEMNKGL